MARHFPNPPVTANGCRQTIDPIGSAPAKMAGERTNGRTGALSIRPFQVSRWRLRRTRQLWVLNALLVLGYGVTEIGKESGSTFGKKRSGAARGVDAFGRRQFDATRRTWTHVRRWWNGGIEFGPQQCEPTRCSWRSILQTSSGSDGP